MDKTCKVYQAENGTITVEIHERGQGPFIYTEYETWDSAIEFARAEGFANLEVRT